MCLFKSGVIAIIDFYVEHDVIILPSSAKRTITLTELLLLSYDLYRFVSFVTFVSFEVRKRKTIEMLTMFRAHLTHRQIYLYITVSHHAHTHTHT